MLGAHLDRMSEQRGNEALGPGAWVLRAFAEDAGPELLRIIDDVVTRAPFRHLTTPGGRLMSVAMTNCGDVGWVSGPKGYRYDPVDPLTGEHWPAMPPPFLTLAGAAALQAGYSDFVPTVCLINRYGAGAALAMHQDRDTTGGTQPVVSVSLGLPAAFKFGGQGQRSAARKILLLHGDVVVWGGPSRMNRHGVLPLAPGCHSLSGPYRFNLTFRVAN